MEAIDQGGVEALSEYVQGLREDLSAQMLTANRGDLEPTDNIRVTARIQVSKLREQIAAACGVVTERKGVEQSGSVDVNVLGKLKGTTRQSMIDDLESPDQEEPPAANGEGG